MMPVRERSSCFLSQLFLKQVSQRPHKIALKSISETVTFSQLHSRVATIRHALARSEGTTRQSPLNRTFTVAILCGNSPIAEICAVLAVVLAGGCFVPLDETLPPERLRQVVEDAQPNAVITLSDSFSVAQHSGPSVQGAAVVLASAPQGCQVLHLNDSGQQCQLSETANYSREIQEHESNVGRDNGVQEESLGQHRSANQPQSWLRCISGRRTGSADKDALGRAYQDIFAKDPGPVAPDEAKPSADGNVLAGAEMGSFLNSFDEDLLYILYTSGTTGVPKGVRGTRSGAVNRILFGWSVFPFRENGELVCRRTPSCFVDFVAETFCPLLAGVPMFLPPRGAHADPLLLVPALLEAKTTRITVTPSLLASMLRTSDAEPLLPEMHTWFVSGEALHADLALQFRRQAAPGAQLVNLYGSTEVSGDATYCVLDDILQAERGRNSPITADDGGVLIGKPLPGVHLSIVGADLSPLPVGQVGELLVGGVGVALGYHRRPEETARKFLRSSAQSNTVGKEGEVYTPGMEAGHRVVCTGDRVVQRMADGPLFWLGRLDDEVQVRGVRVSLLEVEMLACRACGLPVGAFAIVYDQGIEALSTFDSKGQHVDGATRAVAAQAPDRGRLLGFFVSNDVQKDVNRLAELRLQLAAVMTPSQLPAVLIPVVGGFPLTTTGKVDRRALLREQRSQNMGTDAQSTTPAEEKCMTLPYNNSSMSVGNLDDARRAIAHGIVSVLPEARATVEPWLKMLEAGPQDGLDLSQLTFGSLGGTSLLAVEAAWRTSLSVAGIDTGSNGGLASSSSTLNADDFLRGTLEEVAETLYGVLQMRSRATGAETSSVNDTRTTLLGSATANDKRGEHLTPRSHPVEEELPSKGRAVAPPLVHSSCAGRKRQRSEIGEPDQLLRQRHTMALGRGGAVIHHSPVCWGEETDLTSKAAEVDEVKLSVRWSSCLSKCIDASPLLVFDMRRAISRPSIGCVEEPDGVVGESQARSDSPECSSHSRPRCSLPINDSVSPARGKSVLCHDTSMRGSEARLDEGVVYVGSHSGEFRALNLATGEVHWSFKAGGRIESGAACSLDGLKVYVGCHDGYLYAIDRQKGTLVWSFKTRDAIKCTPVSMSAVPNIDPDGPEVFPNNSGTAVLVGSHDGVLRSLSEGDGGLRWSFDCGGSLFASPAQSSDARVVYAATTKGRVVALDVPLLVLTGLGEEIDVHTKYRGRGVSSELSPERPTIRWDIHLPAPCFSTPAVCYSTGNVVLGCVDGGLYCLSSGGKQLWVCRGEKPVFSSPCLLPSMCRDISESKNHMAGSRVVWGCHDGRVRCSSGPGLTWETNVDDGTPVFSSPCFAAVACEGCTLLCPLVFICSVRGSITVLSSAHGKVVGRKKLPGEIFSSAVVAGRNLVVGCRDNRVYVLNVLFNCVTCHSRVENL